MLQSMAKQGSSPQAEDRVMHPQSNVPSPFAQMQASPLQVDCVSRNATARFCTCSP